MSLFIRFITLLLLITTFTFSKSITIKPHYCVNENLKLNSTFFGATESFEIITIPKTRTNFTVPSLYIKNPFEKKSYDVIDSSTGVVTFERFCNLAGKKDEIAQAVLLEFEKLYPCIDAKLPTIKPSSPLPFDFKAYKLIKVNLKQSSFRRKNASFQAVFQTPNNNKSIYFKFTINAFVDIFKAKHKLHNDTILSEDDYKKVSVKLDKLPSKIITCSMPKDLMTKNYISANSILTTNKFTHKKEILRGTAIQAYLKEGMLVLEIKAKVLKNGNIGDIVKIKTDNGKLFKAKLISKNKAIIVE
ncbi:MAG: flagellar basal body P-ring formation protein FlgA [Sulfurospirillum sp.]|nr:flagellar basal body P-ring formation protein FlgA [Sulfurospirillum sp.]